MKFKLNLHQRSQRAEDVLLQKPERPENGVDAFDVGDVIEIAQTKCPMPLYVQIQRFAKRDEHLPKETISLAENLGQMFRMTNFSDVTIQKVDKERVAADSIEVTFRDQYISRSDMWRIKNHLRDTCVYVGKQIEFLGKIRLNIFEIWSQGERQATGYVTSDTKIVFRSNTAMVNLFIQMSSEMWEFDINGDLYFEKMANYFLNDLFNLWKRMKCTHDVTIVLFSRNFYDAKSEEDFPPEMRPCLQKDHLGRFYEDFYRVAVQNERYDDWSPPLTMLRRLFNKYHEEVINRHEIVYGKGRVPKAYNSTASQGNFLEVLNLSLNVFEKHFMYRSFDRTGQLSVVISPGVGYFEVDFEMTNITKQRIIDNGIGSDLVCLGEQPLHAVPLFRFNSRNMSTWENLCDVYNMPHWINLSFYSSPKRRTHTTFVPRIKLPTDLSFLNHRKQRPVKEQIAGSKKDRPTFKTQTSLACSPTPNNSATTPNGTNSNNNATSQFRDIVDYDAYDAEVWKIPSRTTNINKQSLRRRSCTAQSIAQTSSPSHRSSLRRGSEFSALENKHNSHYSGAMKSSEMTIPEFGERLTPTPTQVSASFENLSLKDLSDTQWPKWNDDSVIGPLGGSALSLNCHRTASGRPKALINPFDPSHVTIKLTSNRRRWTHVFPQGPTGIFMQQHHYQAIPQNTASSMLPINTIRDSFVEDHDSTGLSAQKSRKISMKQIKFSDRASGISNPERGSSGGVGKAGSGPNIRSSGTGIMASDKNTVLSNQTERWAWGATGEQEWTPAITTGVDWKSLAIPACLPLTTDFFPETRSIECDYVMYTYTLIPEEQAIEMSNRRCYRKEEDRHSHDPLSTREVFIELINQRLQQGFQIILLPPKEKKRDKQNKAKPLFEDSYHLSIGRIFHKLQIEGSEIHITQYRPRHPYQTNKPISYCYRLRGPDNETFGEAWNEMMCEKLENYNWNYLDNYICTRGEEDELRDSLKYWRFRLFALPARYSITKHIIENDVEHFDLYSEMSEEEKTQCIESFVRLFEMINRIRKRFKTAQSSGGNPELPLRALPGTGPIRGPSARRPSGSQIQKQSSDEIKGRQRRRTGTSLREDVTSTTVVDGGVLSATALPLVPTMETTFTSAASDESLRIMPPTPLTPNQQLPPETLDESMEVFPESKKLLSVQNLTEILEEMKRSSEITYFTKTEFGLPSHTFISADAVLWAKKHVGSIETEDEAVALFQEMLEDGKFCHASGDKKMPFKFGTFLYYIVEENQNDRPENAPVDIEMYNHEWLEVEITKSDSVTRDPDIGGFSFLQENKAFTFKKAKLDLEISKDHSKNHCRKEWLHIKYHSLYDPEQAFEMVVEWMVATGVAIPELIQGWTRKMQQPNYQGLHLFPLPCDPFALPSSLKSDPLRGPIYVSLNLDIVPESKLPGGLSEEDVIRFQERIIVKFGFIPFHDPDATIQRQFVHACGGVFLMIPNINKNSSLFSNLNQLEDKAPKSTSPHEDYITKHFTGTRPQPAESKVGFLWAWNHMMTKRWRTSSTGDEHTHRRLMKDFCDFVMGKDQRLLELWNDYRSSGHYHSRSSNKSSIPASPCNAQMAISPI